MQRPAGASAANAPHSQTAAPSRIAQKTIQPNGGRKKSADANTTSRTAAVSARVFSMKGRALLPVRQAALRDPPPPGAFALGLVELFAGAPEPALALLVPCDRRVELIGVEVRPQR